MKTWGLYDQGFNYDIVAVFGSQSTGKSTLLNALFSTDFDVMNESERRQTTKGIWMAKGKQMPVLVMDVEGTGVFYARLPCDSNWLTLVTPQRWTRTWRESGLRAQVGAVLHGQL